MAAKQTQVEADAAETELMARYRRQRELMPLVADAVRRAEAAARLEASLRHQPRARLFGE